MYTGTVASQEDRLVNLMAKTQQARYEYLQTELMACFAAAEHGISELMGGNRAEAERESQTAESGYEAIVHSLAVLDEGANRERIEEEWNSLRERLDYLQELLKSSN